LRPFKEASVAKCEQEKIEADEKLKAFNEHTEELKAGGFHSPPSQLNMSRI